MSAEFVDIIRDDPIGVAENGNASFAELNANELTGIQEMHASISRTAFMGTLEVIPVISSDILQTGNNKVEREFGENARHVTIIGPDAIKFDDGPVELISGRRVGQALGFMVASRGIYASAHYLNLGFFDNSDNDRGRLESLAKCRQYLLKITDLAGNSLLRQTGPGHKTAYGIDDIVFTDLRNTNTYKKTRKGQANKLWKAHVLTNGKSPHMLEIPVLAAAQDTIALLGDKKLNRAQLDRLKKLNAQVSEFLNPKKVAPISKNSTSPPPQNTAFDPDWRLKAACHDQNLTSIFYADTPERKPEKTARIATAKSICASCTVQPACLENVLATEPRANRYGVCAGLTEAERSKIYNLRV